MRCALIQRTITAKVPVREERRCRRSFSGGGGRVAVDFGRGLVGFVCFRWVTDGRAWRCAGRRWRVWFVTLVGEREVEGGTRPWMGAVKWMQTRWCERGKGRPYGGGIHGFTSRTWACKAYRPSRDWRRVRPGGGGCANCVLLVSWG
jgi:hypothetical protein